MNDCLTAADFLLDLKALLREFYVGTVAFDDAAVEVRLENGQTFTINVSEVSH